jgi:branched-chain amino acid transport system substrate-binding protein
MSADRTRAIGTPECPHNTRMANSTRPISSEATYAGRPLLATYSAISILHKAFKTVRSTDVRKVAYAMEGLKFTSLNGDVEMRQSDHQLQQPLFVATWARTNGKDVRYDDEKTGYGWRSDRTLDARLSSRPTSCEMKRPAR